MGLRDAAEKQIIFMSKAGVKSVSGTTFPLSREIFTGLGHFEGHFFTKRSPTMRFGKKCRVKLLGQNIDFWNSVLSNMLQDAGDA